MIITLRIAGMTCNHCARTVGDALRAVPGVTAVEVDLAAGRASVTYGDPATVSQLTAAVAEAGYEAQS